MNRSPTHRRRPPQISLRFMMLMWLVLSIMSAGLFYGSRVPVVQEEISVLVDGKSATNSEKTGRLAHITFIMFTFTSPLILAAGLWSSMSLLRWFRSNPPLLVALQRHPATRWMFR